MLECEGSGRRFEGGVGCRERGGMRREGGWRWREGGGGRRDGGGVRHDGGGRWREGGGGWREGGGGRREGGGRCAAMVRGHGARPWRARATEVGYGARFWARTALPKTHPKGAKKKRPVQLRGQTESKVPKNKSKSRQPAAGAATFFTH